MRFLLETLQIPISIRDPEAKYSALGEKTRLKIVL